MNGGFLKNGVDTEIFKPDIFHEARLPIETWLNANEPMRDKELPDDLHISGWVNWARSAKNFADLQLLVDDIVQQLTDHKKVGHIPTQWMKNMFPHLKDKKDSLACPICAKLI